VIVIINQQREPSGSQGVLIMRVTRITGQLSDALIPNPGASGSPSVPSSCGDLALDLTYRRPHPLVRAAPPEVRRRSRTVACVRG
jgi:hypothetical protein